MPATLKYREVRNQQIAGSAPMLRSYRRMWSGMLPSISTPCCWRSGSKLLSHGSVFRRAVDAVSSFAIDVEISKLDVAGSNRSPAISLWRPLPGLPPNASSGRR